MVSAQSTPAALVAATASAIRRWCSQRRRQDLAPGHRDHGLGLDGELLDVLLDRDVDPRLVLGLAQHAVLLEQIHVLLGPEHAEGLDRVLQVGQPAPLRLRVPLLRVVVAVEDDPLVLA